MRIGTLKLRHNVFLAPMAGITDLAFRTVAHRFGAALCFTEMISAVGLARQSARTRRYLASSPEDRPLGAQLFGADPHILAEAARIATDEKADLIDINMGCPVKKVVKSGAGAAMMKDPAKVSLAVALVRRATDLPVTVKLRAGWRRDSVNVVDIARIAEDSGADSVTVHPRTASQGFQGCADWKLIEEVKRAVSIPVIASGDLWTPEDARKVLDSTGCDGVMVARGSLGNPWIFEAIQAYLNRGIHPPPPRPALREATIIAHLEMSIALYGETAGVRSFRKHLLWYTKGLPGGAQFRNAATMIKDLETLLDLLHSFLHSPDIDGGALQGRDIGSSDE